MTDTETQDETPKKPRKPRSDKGKKKTAPKKEAVEAKEPKQPRSKKLPCFVRQEGKVVTLSGADVFCRPLDAAARTKWGVKDVKGQLGEKCATEETVLTFKSPKAAAAFFDYSFNAEDENDEIIVAGGKTDWEGESIAGF